MIVGIGIDCVLIERFAHWFYYSSKQLEKIYSEEELAYIFSNPAKQKERFASRFAAKEACFKALAAIFPQIYLQFYACLPRIEVKRKANGAVYLSIEYKKIFPKLVNSKKYFRSHLSLSHDKVHAHAYVIIEKLPRNK